MFSKTTLVSCSLVLFIQSALSQCNSPAAVFADPAYNGPVATPYGLGTPYGFPASYLGETYGCGGPFIAEPYGYDIPLLNEPYGYGAPILNEPYGYGAPFLNEPYGYGTGYVSPYGCSALEFSPTSGGSLPITSASGIPPVGISVVSDNVFEGLLAVVGELPFVGTVGMESTVPSFGYGAINHACGNGISAMVSDITAYAPGYGAAYSPMGAIAPGLPSPGLGYDGWIDRGCGCAIY